MNMSVTGDRIASASIKICHRTYVIIINVVDGA